MAIGITPSVIPGKTLASGGGPMIPGASGGIIDTIKSGVGTVVDLFNTGKDIYNTLGGGGCQAGFVKVGDQCIPGVTGGQPGGDATPGGVTPAEASVGASGILLPAREARPQFVCPKYADGKTGILWMNALTGQVVCLPRGVSGAGFGLKRKNKPRAKAYITRAEFKTLAKMKAVQKKAKKYAMDAGFTCTPKGRKK